MLANFSILVAVQPKYGFMTVKDYTTIMTWEKLVGRMGIWVRGKGNPRAYGTLSE